MSHAFYRITQGKECRIPFSDRSRGERTPHTSFRRRSRPLGQAYAPSEVSGILFFEIQVKGKTIFGVIGYYVYGKMRLYARPKIAATEPHGGGGLNGNSSS